MITAEQLRQIHESITNAYSAILSATATPCVIPGHEKGIQLLHDLNHADTIVSDEFMRLNREKANS